MNIFIILTLIAHYVLSADPSSVHSKANSIFIKNKIENFMIKARRFGLSSMSRASGKIKNNVTFCKDPDLSFIEERRVDMMRLFYDGFSILDHAAVIKILENFTIGSDQASDTVDSLEYGAKQCNESSLKILHDHERGLCPWHYKIEYRNDRYPMTRLQAKCNCNNGCYFLNNKINSDGKDFDCHPIRKLMPILVRGDCADGVFNWNIMFENVAIACMCMKNDVDIDKR